jgi:hypothetical protein
MFLDFTYKLCKKQGGMCYTTKCDTVEDGLTGHASEGAMEDLPEVERRALESELEEEMDEARRRKLVCFKKIYTGVIKKTVPAITTMATATPMVTPNRTPEELVSSWT